MPEVTFDIVWPDGSKEQFYSPSTVVKKYIESGQTYDLQDFVRRSQESLILASDRVKQMYGSPCALAIGQLRRVENKAIEFAAQDNAQVKVL